MLERKVTNPMYCTKEMVGRMQNNTTPMQLLEQTEPDLYRAFMYWEGGGLQYYSFQHRLWFRTESIDNMKLPYRLRVGNVSSLQVDKHTQINKCKVCGAIHVHDNDDYCLRCDHKRAVKLYKRYKNGLEEVCDFCMSHLNKLVDIERAMNNEE